ncbi:MAG: FAD-dependent oxidoreductase [Hyphomicrobiales bacterium]|nr:FAD-dependent oxidoreductase [Hyphomicrobiales bacterium]
MDMLNPRQVGEAERIGRKQVKSIVNFLKREAPGFENAILTNIATRVGVRETRRIVGQYTLTAEDILEQRSFDDVIALGCGPMDVHDPNGTSVSLSMPPAPWDIPMRCLVPAGVEGLLVTGRAISATQEANGGSRHMATAMALGHATGTMAAIAVDQANSPLSVPTKVVQAALHDTAAAISVEDCERLTQVNAN